MPASLHCPTCSAPLDLPPAGETRVKCPYCGAAVLLSEAGAGHPRGVAPDTTAEIVRLLRAGQWLPAIQLYRERTGVGLKEAKEAVERIAAAQPPGSVPRPPNARVLVGCALFLLVLAGAGALLPLMLLRRESAPAGEGAAPVAERGASSPARPGARAAEESGLAERVLAFGGKGTGAGRFTDARGVAVDGQGRVYVAEYQGGRVQVFDSLGTFVTQWMADPKMPLVDLAADRGGTVYVVQSGRIRRYEGATGRLLGEVGRRQRSATYSDVALALDGTLYAVEWPSSIVQLGPGGRVLRTIDAHAAIGDQASPARLAVAGTGDLYVLDQWTGEVYRLDPSGRFVDRFGGKGGDGPEQLRSPNDLALDGRGRVYVSDLGRAIRVFTPEGHLVGDVGGRGVVFGMAITDRDELYAAYRNDHQIVKFRIRE
ncbi:MAG TPA: hypothetical protein VF746_28585 [Longimicrobium sp.]|jgi:DNA-directed RNA polymerase subunit RPC12/RpoP